MKKQEKCLEYYLDSKTNSNEDIIKNIEETKKEFANKKIEVEVTLNEWGVYIIKYNFKSKRKNKIKPKIYLEEEKSKIINIQKEQRKYGQYKSAGIYKPF